MMLSTVVDSMRGPHSRVRREHPAPTHDASAPCFVVLAGGNIIDLDATFIVQLIIFFVVFLILNSLVFKPMLALFKARTVAIDGARQDAKRMEKEAGEKADTFDEEMRKVRLEAGTERDRLRQEGTRMERQVLEKVRKETQDSMRAADQKMAAEAVKVRSDIETVIPELAREIAGRLLGREVA